MIKKSILMLIVIVLFYSQFVGQNAPVQRKEIKLDPKIFQVYVGKYQSNDNPEFFVTIMTENGLFYTQATAQPRFQIFAESENTFFLKVVDAQIKFIKGKDGKVAEMIVFQNGGEMHFKKVE